MYFLDKNNVLYYIFMFQSLNDRTTKIMLVIIAVLIMTIKL